MVSKRDIRGISGCFWEKCLSFDFQYIMHIREDGTPRDKHLHNPNMINEANNLQIDQQKSTNSVCKRISHSSREQIHHLQVN
jgi:hypothetical protein